MSQNVITAPRISGPVNEKSLVVLKGNVPSLAKSAFDAGEAPASTQLSHVRLVLSRSPQQQAALDQYDAELQDKSSPNYHKWLTPEQFGHLYGPADSDIEAIVIWLEAHGLKVEPVPPGRISIAFSGSVEQIEETFRTSIHSYDTNGRQFFSNSTNPSIPSALQPVVFGVAGLNTIKPRPQYIRGRMGTYDPALGRLAPVPSTSSSRGPKADLTGGSGTSSDPYLLYIVAGDAATIYDAPTSLNANFSGTSYTGKGVNIGYAGDSSIQPSTVASYRSRFIGDSTQPTVTNVDGVTENGDSDEAYLDAEAAGGLAPGATLHFYTAQNLSTAIEQAITDNKVDIFNVSFGLCELAMVTADNMAYNGLWQQAATQGIAVTVSTGDNGSAACDDNSSEITANYGLMVSGLASTPYNIAVGGTDTYGLIPTGSYTTGTFLTYVGTEPTDPTSTLYRTVKKYIPEATWNDSVESDGALSANTAYQDSTTGDTNIVAGSGGPSNCAYNLGTSEVIGTCTAGYPKPAWQRGTGVPTDGVRDLPDVSLMAGAGADYAAWLVCTDESGPNSNNVTVTADCTKQSDGNFYFMGIGGTSAAAPAFAGILALVQQKTGSRLGQAAQDLYDLANGTHSAAVFHDITQGNISVPCTSGSPNCATNTAGNPFLTGYDTGAGYDLATGLGSVDVTQLISYWNTARASGTATVTINSLGSGAIGTESALALTGTVSAKSGTPTGSVVVLSAGYTSSPVNLTAGAFTVTVPAESLLVGDDTITVNYSGDTHFEPASATAAITITGAKPSLTLTPSSTTIKATDTLSIQVSVSGTGATPSGTVALSNNSYVATGQPLTSGSYTFSIPGGNLMAGNNAFTVTYSGDRVYASGTANTTVAVSAAYALAATTPAAVSAGGSTSSTITVSTASGYAGTVTLTCTVTGPSGATNLPQCKPAGTVTLSSNVPSAKTTIAITTTGSTAQLQRPRIRGGWLGAGGGLTLAFLILFGIPAQRRRSWLSLMGMLVLLVTLGSLAACGGGGGGGSGGGGSGGGGTTAGTYTFTVSGTGSDTAKTTASTTFKLTVN